MLQWLFKKILGYQPEKIPGWYKKGRRHSYKYGQGKGYENGYREGHIHGYEQGYDNGHKLGYEKGKLVFEIKDSRSPSKEPQIDAAIYGPGRFPVSDEIIKEMKAKTSEMARRGEIIFPSESQWEMILSDNHATQIIAGAGAGKSTTLVLRIVFMHFYLKIPLDTLSIVSFTRASCQELRDKLKKTFRCWGYDSDISQLEKRVKTFHSLLLSLISPLVPNIQWFENINDSDDKKYQNQAVINTRLSIKQKEELNKAYRQLYNEHEKFKKIIDMLFLQSISIASFSSDERDEKHYYKLKKASERDKNLVEEISARWREKGLWPIKGISDTVIPVFKAKGYQFYANGYVTDTHMPVFLDGECKNILELDSKELISDLQGITSFPLKAANYVKKQIISWYCNQQNILLKDSDSINSLSLWLDKEIISAPLFKIILSGESERADIIDAFYQQASFIEALGLEVSTTVNHLEFKSKNTEFYFAEALGIFWPYAEKYLKEQNVLTFNRGFLLLSNDEFLERMFKREPYIFNTLQHLLIDEFQDISPLIANWLLKIQRLLSMHYIAPSIMAIGDDWQSIYGWRGSSARFFIQFDKQYSTHPDTPVKQCFLMENYRSDSQILSAAEIIADKIKDRITKTSISKRKPTGGEEGMQQIYYDLVYENGTIQALTEKILMEKALVGQQKKHDKNLVIVLSRTNDVLHKLQKYFNEHYRNELKGIGFYTIHQAKGLQGEVAIIIGDCCYPETHILRNQVYKQFKYNDENDVTGDRYDRIMRDEAYRLAYVAITRGIKRVFWYLPKKSGINSIISTTNSDRNKSF